VRPRELAPAAEAPGLTAPLGSAASSPRGGRVITLIVQFFLLLVGAGYVGALIRSGEQATTLAVQSSLLLAYLAMYGLLALASPPRPLPIAGSFFLFAANQPASLLVATLSDGQVDYINNWGVFSHHTQTGRVALAEFYFFSIVFGVLFLLARTTPRAPSTWKATLDMISPRMLRALQWIGIATQVDRILVESGLFNAVAPVAYVARLFTGWFTPAIFFVGVGVRRRENRATMMAVAMLPIALLLLLTGSRTYALLPLAYLGAGFILARPMPAVRLQLLAVIGVSIFSVAMYIGDVARSDERGRSLEAAVDRAGSLGEQVEATRDSLSVSDSAVRRILRNGDHAVLTMIPEALPFERDGLAKLPEELLIDLWPGLHFSGRTEKRLPRIFLLNEIGFFVSWQTSLPLGLVPDAWWRGGWLGLTIIAVIAALVVKMLELFIYHRMADQPERVFLLLSCVAALMTLEQHDIIHAVKAILWLMAANAALLAIVRAFTSRVARQGNVTVAAPALSGRTETAV
jgi:hypothetical protein